MAQGFFLLKGCEKYENDCFDLKIIRLIKLSRIKARCTECIPLPSNTDRQCRSGGSRLGEDLKKWC